MKRVILFRPELSTNEERIMAKEVFRNNYFEYRSEIPKESLVIARYSTLPFYEELESELALNGSRLLNSYREHMWIASMEWAQPGGVLQDLTPTVYDRWDNIPEGQYIVKGRLNSRKQQWNQKMFAPNKASISEIARALYDDQLIASQGVVVRPYVQLKSFGTGIGGIPVSNEHRTFWFVDEEDVLCLGEGFYWSNFPEFADKASLSEVGFNLAKEAAERIQKSKKATFFAIDVAETEAGGWIVIEVNDGQSSGLSNVSAKDFYTNLKWI